MTYIVLLLLALVGGVQSIYEDQVGSFDWHVPKIGAIQQVAYANSAKLMKKKLLFVATTEGAVAALKTSTGEIVWRRMHNPNEPVNAIQVYDKVVVSVSGNQYVSAWNGVDGSLLWSAPIPDVPGSDKFSVKGLLPGQAKLLGVAGAKVHQFDVDLEEGLLSLSKTIDVPALEGQNADLTQLTTTGLVVINPAKSVVVAVDIASGQVSEKSYPKGNPDVTALIDSHHTCDSMVLKLDLAKATIISIKSEGIEIAEPFALQPGETISTCSSLDGTTPVLRALTSASGTTLKIESMEGTALGFEVSLPEVTLTQQGLVSRVAIQSTAGKEGGLVFRALMVMDDATALFVGGKGQIWERSEGLASIQDAVFVNLPKAVNANDEEDEDEDPISAIVSRLTSQVTDLHSKVSSFISWGVTETQGLMSGAIGGKKVAKPQIDDMSQDKYGFNKLILAHNQLGTLYAIHTSRGAVAWRRSLKYDAVSLVLKSLGKDASDYARFMQRCKISILGSMNLDETHDKHVYHELITAISVDVYGANGATPESTYTVVLKVKAFDGTIILGEVYPEKMIHTMLLPFHFTTPAKTVTNPFLMIDSDFEVHVFPKLEAAKTMIAEMSSQIFFYLANTDANTITGYGLTSDATKASMIWQVGFNTPAGEAIDGLSFKTTDPKNLLVANNVRAMEGGFSFKYANPNVFAVATTLPVPLSADGKPIKGQGPRVNVYLIDGVSGAILNQMNIPNAYGPVQLMGAENYIVIQYLNAKALQYELGLWEMLETSNDEDAKSAPKLLLKSMLGAKVEARSSFTAPSPIVEKKTLSFPHPIKCLALTLTAKAITNRLILAGSASDQLMGLDLNTMTANKPLSTVNTPNQPSTYSYLSYNLTVYNMRKIKSAPATLESTSHVLAIGTDMFYTRVAPAATFDLLNDDFSYFPLCLTIMAMAGACIATSNLASRSTLARAWA